GLVGDQIRLAQILSNLASNAVKFTHEGQVTLKVETVHEGEKDVTLRFSICDTGIGLTREQMDSLFSAFTQADTSTTRRYGGTGLGLIISKRLVEIMGGTISVESELGLGSTFSFTAKFGTHKALKRYVEGNKDFQGLRALAIDDNILALEILGDFLKATGFQVEIATSGYKALEILAQHSQRDEHFDLVFIDWKMPGMDGIETTIRINQLIAPSKLPVIIMATAYNRDEVIGLAKQNGIKNVMTKPLSPSTILNLLMDIFGCGAAEKKNHPPAKGHEKYLVKDYIGSKILLAEDNEVNQLVASRILRNAGFEIDIANNGVEALKMLEAANYDLVLMDIQMPEMDGLSATRKIRSTPKFSTLPIVAMTAHAMSGDKDLSLKAGMNDHINKPINLVELFSTLAKWLNKS
ncbi:MAG: response regulator, partial [Candidatus Adiutrix sp.]